MCTHFYLDKIACIIHFGLVYVTMERDWLLESICKAVIRLQLDGKLEKLSVNIVCFHNHSDVSIVTPKIGWEYDEDEAMELASSIFTTKGFKMTKTTKPTKSLKNTSDDDDYSYLANLGFNKNALEKDNNCFSPVDRAFPSSNTL